MRKLSTLGHILKEVAVISASALVAVVAFKYLLPGVADQKEKFDYIQDVKHNISSMPIVTPGRILANKRAGALSSQWAMVLFTSPDCGYCQRSADFHRRLIDEARSRSLPLVVAVPRVKEAAKFLSKLNRQRIDAESWEDLTLRADGTPSLVLIGPGGAVRKVWLGLLSAEREQAVLRAIGNPSQVSVAVRSLPSGELMLTSDQLERLRAQRPVTILYAGEREGFVANATSGAINIPLDELSVRAEAELNRSEVQVLDCVALNDNVCFAARRTLIDLGFEVKLFGGL